MPSEGQKYVTGWEREQDRVAGLSGDGFAGGDGSQPTDAPFAFAVSSLNEETFGNGRGSPMDEGEENRQMDEEMQENVDQKQEGVDQKLVIKELGPTLKGK